MEIKGLGYYIAVCKGENVLSGQELESWMLKGWTMIDQEDQHLSCSPVCGSRRAAQGRSDNGAKAIYLPKALFHTSVRHKSTSYIMHKSLARTRTSNSRISCNTIRVKERKCRWRLSRASRASPLCWLRPVNSYSSQIYGDFGLFPPPAVFLLSSKSNTDLVKDKKGMESEGDSKEGKNT